LGIPVAFVTKPSMTVIKLLEQKENHPEYEPWMNNLHLDYENPNLSQYQVMFIEQGSENLRICGANLIPSQFYVYRLLRDFVGTVIYLQYDPYISFWPVAETKVTKDQMYFTANTREIFHNKNITILCPGNRGDAYKQLYKQWGIDGFLTFKTFTYDTHDLMYGVLDEYGDQYNPQPNPTGNLCFVGKDRNGGSRYNFFMRMMDKNPDLLLDLYGKWDKADFKDYENTRILKRGMLPRGMPNVLKAYNNSIASPLIANERYIESNQLTFRTYETIASGTLPLIQYEWANKFLEYIDKELVQYLTFDAGTIGYTVKYAQENLEWRYNTIKEVQRQFKASCILHNPFREVYQLMHYASEAPRIDGNHVVEHLAEHRYTGDKNSKYKATRDNAFAKYKEFKEYYSSPISVETTRDIKEIYGFSDSDLNSEQLLLKFGR
jgi:hypothetical protein